MATNYETWCAKTTDIKPLIRAMKSSMPEQYIGYYLELALGSGVLEYQKTFDAAYDALSPLFPTLSALSTK